MLVRGLPRDAWEIPLFFLTEMEVMAVIHNQGLSTRDYDALMRDQGSLKFDC